MKRVRINELKPGMIIDSDVYNKQDQLIVPVDTVLTEEIISRLSAYSIYFVKVKDNSKQ